MNYRAYFSPTHGTENTIKILSEYLDNNNWTDIDLTDYNVRKNHYSLTGKDLLIIGVPVYSGRVPQVSNLFDCLNGNNTPCVICSCFGNRDYDDTLVEMQDKLRQKGFIVIAGGAIVIPHVYNKNIGKGRPDKEDKKGLLEFANKINSKLKSNVLKEVKVDGNRPYKALKKSEQTPILNLGTCIKCGTCTNVCPTNAIDENTHIGNFNNCICCLKCVFECPTKSRNLDVSALTKWLQENCSSRHENVFFTIDKC